MRAVSGIDTILFLSTPSARRATSATAPAHSRRPYFYPRPPRGGRPANPAGCTRGEQRISIHALREEGDIYDVRNPLKLRQISIHALREEGDMFLDEFDHIIKISIHALREEGDHFPQDDCCG